MNRKILVAVGVAALALWIAPSASAQNVLYLEDFEVAEGTPLTDLGFLEWGTPRVVTDTFEVGPAFSAAAAGGESEHAIAVLGPGVGVWEASVEIYNGGGGGSVGLKLFGTGLEDGASQFPALQTWGMAFVNSPADKIDFIVSNGSGTPGWGDDGSGPWYTLLDGLTVGETYTLKYVVDLDSNEIWGEVEGYGSTPHFPWLGPVGMDNISGLGLYIDNRDNGNNRIFDNLMVVGEPAPPGTDFTWKSSELGDWIDASNWSGPVGYPGKTIDTGIPPASTPDRQSALFGDAIGSTGRTVVADTSVSVNAIHFDNSSASYAIAGLGSVNLLASTRPVNPSPAINVAANNSHQFQAIVNFHANGTVDIGSGSTLELNNRLFLNSNALTKTGEGTLAINNNVLTGGGTVNCAQGTCSGTGTIGGDLNNEGGTISPGNSAGFMVIPEPCTYVLIGMGVLMLGVCWRRRRK